MDLVRSLSKDKPSKLSGTLADLSEVRYLRHHQVDNQKWDHCVAASFNGLAYAFSWYLDAVSPEWDALVEGDYESVMPLPVEFSYGLHFSRQPLFCQQLGIFSTEVLNAERVRHFLEAIPKRFRIVKLHLNNHVIVPGGWPEHDWGLTYKLDLIRPYGRLSAAYSSNLRRNLARAEREKVSVVRAIQVKDLIELKRLHPKVALKEADYATLSRLVATAVNAKLGFIYGAFDAHNTLCAAVFFLVTHRHAIYLTSVSTPHGKEIGAMAKLIDQFIRDNAQTSLTLDFEGSKIEGVARFFASFGASPYRFPILDINRLPWHVKLLLKLRSAWTRA